MSAKPHTRLVRVRQEGAAEVLRTQLADAQRENRQLAVRLQARTQLLHIMVGRGKPASKEGAALFGIVQEELGKRLGDPPLNLKVVRADPDPPRTDERRPVVAANQDNPLDPI